MRKVFLIFATVYVAFLSEQALAHFLGRWFIPDVTLVVVVFFNLSRGTRAGLIAAVIAGLLKDSFLPRGFGMHLFAFICDTYLTSILKSYIYQVGSMSSRILMVFVLTLLHNHLLYFLNLLFLPVRYTEMLRYVLLPELVATTVAAAYIFEKFKRCVLRYFV